MYLMEWGWWGLQKMSPAQRKKSDAITPPHNRHLEKDSYEGDLDAEQHFNPVSDLPRSRGPVYELNDTYMEVRCGGLEEKRGIITIITFAMMCPMLYFWLPATIVFIYEDFAEPELSSIGANLITLFMIFVFLAVFYFYFKYGFQFTRLEIFTNRHLIARFNRITQQVHLHRPKYCGGIVTFPWKSTGSTAIDPADDALGAGVRLGLVWHPSRTGLPHMEMALVGKQGQGGSELRDEWEFIRRYMEEGPESVPRPRLSTQLPSPIQAYSAQFEGIGRFIRNSGWAMKLALLLISPVFVILGTAHWISLMLCWRPRWPKIIREAGLPGKPIPPITTLKDYPPEIQERLLANADRYELKPGDRPLKRSTSSPRQNSKPSNKAAR